MQQGVTRDDFSQEDGQSSEQSQEKKAAQIAEELEEIALGSVKGKVPKALAKAIKDFERGSQAKMREAAEARKQAHENQQLLALLDRDPDAFAEHYARMTGKRLDLDAFAEERLARKYDLMHMTPEQRRLYDAEQRLQQMERAELQSKSGVIAEIRSMLGEDAPPNLEKFSKEELQGFLHQQRAVQDHVQQSLNNEVVEAWKESGLPKHKYFGALMSFTMMSHIRQNREAIERGEIQPLQAKEAAARVKEDFTGVVREVVAQMDPQGIQDLLGKEILAKIRQHDIDRVTAKAASEVGLNRRPGASPASENPRKPMNEYEWRDHIRRMKV